MKNSSWFKKIGIVAVALSAMMFVMAGCDQNVEPEHTFTKPVLKKGTDFTSALTENLGVEIDNVTKVVFALLSEDGIKEKVKALEKNKTNIGEVDNTCYAYAESEGGNLIIYIVPADENVTGFVFNEDCSEMFYEFKKCEIIEGLSLADTSNVTDMSSMFDSCYNLKTLDVSKFDTSKVTSMYAMFYYCTTLTTLDVSNFNTSNVTEMKSMFSWCVDLTSLDLSNFDTSKVTDMSYMFQYSSRLKSLDLSSFDTSKVTTMQEMFESTNLREIIVADKSKFVPEGCTVTDMFKDAAITSTDGLTNKTTE